MGLCKQSIFRCLFGCLFIFSIMAAPVQAGTLTFYASGEDLATEGFQAPRLTKDGWALTFSHIFVTLTDITAYQTDPPYDPNQGGPIPGKTQATLPGVHTLDLVMSAQEDDRVLVGAVMDAPAGHYNALSWKMTRATEGILAGYSMVLTGTAEKEGETVPFQLYSEEERTYRCGEYVGDERKGLLAEQGEADLEITFHLDHIFGRADKPADDPMNTEAPGFAPFTNGDGKQTLTLHGLHIGHAGEGHCNVEWH
ncbi:hypothetical protein [Desulfobulbus alkaliphilus]|uniref:hypothetical protein n=1 Tax=Desulfobulbus alkaliphilus TaxID=869814 RepID=UPI001963719E|nr:hypothetical protein [Desulfobulbus alkaliphilus]MBM9536074.1 hypothetical protein [Desulfobulbus alkaliphilus]